MSFNSPIYSFVYVLSTNLSSSLFSYKILKSSFDFMINYDIELQKPIKVNTMLSTVSKKMLVLKKSTDKAKFT